MNTLPIKGPEGTLGVVVARFQVPQLHEAHLGLLNTIVSRHKRAAVFLGIARAITEHDPLDFETRRLMINQAFPNITVLSIPDFKSDKAWAEELDRRIREHFVFDKPVLYGGRDSFIKSYTPYGKFPTAQVEPIMDSLSGTQYRLEAAAEALPSVDFRKGVIYAAYNQYPKVIPTVDVAIWRNRELLLGRKPGEAKWRFVGGYADVRSGKYEIDAIRETREETGVTTDHPVYIGSTVIEDWRYTGRSRDRIKTLLFAAQYMFGAAIAADDIAEVKWFSYDDLCLDLVEDLHRPLMCMFMHHVGLKPGVKKEIMPADVHR